MKLAARHLLPLLALAALAATASLSLRAADAPDAPAAPPAAANALTLKTNRIVIFKDGYGLVMKDGSATADADGRVFTTSVPDSAVLGTVWAVSDKDKLLSMSSQWDNQHEVRKEQSPCLTVRELLRANLTRRVTLDLDDKRSITGTVAEIMEAPEKIDAATLQPIPAFTGAPPAFALESDTPIDPFTTSSPLNPRQADLPAGTRLVRESTPRGGDFVVISNETDRQVLPISKILSLSGKDLVTTMTRQQDVYSRDKRLTFDFGKEAAGKPVALHFFYFTPGIRWVPTYRITGNLKDSADLALQGEIINDLEDISSANVDLVVGVPNFRFKDVPSPLVLETVLRHAVARSDFNNFNGNQMLNSQMGNNSYSGRTTVDAPDSNLPAELAAGTGTEQDLFIYPLENFSLRKTGRATAALWQSNAPVRNVYTFDIKGRRNPNSGGIAYGNSPSDPASPSHLSTNTIWHQLELTNNSKVPWTTGSALTLKGALPLGQDILGYTSVGSKTLLPLTIAVDLRGTTDEEEVSRKPNAAQFQGNEYALINKKGTITLTNSRKEDSDMCVSLAIGGKVDSASDNAKIKLNDYQAADWEQNGYTQFNNHSDVSWECTLKPGESKTLTYTVSFYAR